MFKFEEWGGSILFVLPEQGLQYFKPVFVIGKYASDVEPEPVGAGTFWSDPEPVWRSGSTLDKTEEIRNYHSLRSFQHWLNAY